MKITALMPDDLIQNVKRLSGGRNVTESLLIALNDWTNQQKLKSLRERIARKPLRFKPGFTAGRARSANRK